MKFAIQNTLWEDPSIEYPVLVQKYHAVSSNPDDPFQACAIIEIGSLEQLLELSRDVGHEIIVHNTNEFTVGSLPKLEIYDTWRE